MKYALNIREHNLKPHLDLEEEVKLRQDGLLTFTIRVNNGNIVDLNVTEYVNAKRKYGIVTGVIVEKYTIALDSGERGKSNPVGSDYVYSTTTQGDSLNGHTQHSEEQKA